jgi:hypothetical protein
MAGRSNPVLRDRRAAGGERHAGNLGSTKVDAKSQHGSVLASPSREQFSWGGDPCSRCLPAARSLFAARVAAPRAVVPEGRGILNSWQK